MTGSAWKAFQAAYDDQVEAVRRLHLVDPVPALRRGLTGGGDFRAAVEYLLQECPPEVVTANLDVVLPLAVDGGAEQGEVRRLVDRLDPAAVSAALPGLVGRVLAGHGDQYHEYSALLVLLDELGERRLFRTVLHAARSAEDPETREAAEGFEYVELVGEIDPPPAAPPAPQVPSAPSAPEWAAYVEALAAHRAAAVALAAVPVERFLPAALADPAARRAAVAWLALLVARTGWTATDSDGTAPDLGVRSVLTTLDPETRAEVLGLLAATFLDDAYLRWPEPYRELLLLLADLDEPAYRTALARGRACPEHDLQAVTASVDG